MSRTNNFNFYPIETIIMQEQNLEPRVNNLESDLRTLNDTVGKLANTVQSQSEATSKQISKIAQQQSDNHQEMIRQQATQHQEFMSKQTELAVNQAQTGRLGGGALIAIFSTFIGLVGLIVTIMTVLGAMTIQPMQAMDSRVEGMVTTLKADTENNLKYALENQEKTINIRFDSVDRRLSEIKACQTESNNRALSRD